MPETGAALGLQCAAHYHDDLSLMPLQILIGLACQK